MTRPIRVLPEQPAPAGRLFALSDDRVGITAHLAAVDDCLGSTMEALSRRWADLVDGQGTDVLGDADLPQLLGALLASGGKRIRPTMSYLGWAAGGGPGADERRQIVTVGAALELLHLFALVHDDVMDESDSRRGVPTVHRQAGDRHAAAGAGGRPELFGTSIAILAGDLALAEAEGLIAETDPVIRRLWRHLVVELVVGQRQDLTGTAARRRDLPFARSVAILKSGCYTVQRPLELGAAAASAPDGVRERLSRYGEHLGEAFALRDDVLGVWGDPDRTGKPAGDDLICGKPTVLLSIATECTRTPAARRALDLVGTPAFGPDELTLLLAELSSNGTRSRVEGMIADSVGAALAALDDPALDPDVADELRQLAHTIAWRER
ncbi:polyprenyl synthetase family protein [Nakamurella sp.]|uniref:polyprenyl synthetase family protein n=1 Tax=Nakamurella sp. TaxID=1869182 RepID=UPI003B3BCCDB